MANFLPTFTRVKKNTDDVKKAARNYIKKLQNISDLYIFF